MADIRATADSILADIAHARVVLEMREQVLAAEIERARAVAAPTIETARLELADLEKELERLCRANRAALFADADRVDLKHGSLMFKAISRAKRVKGMVKRLLEMGLNDLIKRAKPTVDWDRVDKLDDADLAAIGTERVRVETYEWEVR